MSRAEDGRSEGRDEVLHRTRATTIDGRDLSVVIVNLSPGGLMARSERPLEKGERVRVSLPVVGPVWAEVRWALGGRVGCQFERPVPGEFYPRLLKTVGRA